MPRTYVGPFLLFLLAPLSCDGSSVMDAGRRVATIAVAASRTTLMEGDQVQLVATARDSAGAALAGRDVSWSSSDTTVLVVSATGLATARARGQAVVTATRDSVSGTLSLSVLGKVTSLSIVPADTNLRIGQSQQFIAVPRNSQGGIVTGLPVTWSLDPRCDLVVGLDSTGFVRAIAAGGACVKATVDGVVRLSLVKVRSPVAYIDFREDTLRMVRGDERWLVPIIRDSSGTAIRFALPATFASSDASTLTVDSAFVSRAIAHAAGSGSLIATSDGFAAIHPVRVGAARLTVVASRCALTDASEAVCWGQNEESQLGIETPKLSCAQGYCEQVGDTMPVFVSRHLAFTAVSSAPLHACGIAADGAAFCWGGDEWSQLGASSKPDTTCNYEHRTVACSTAPLEVAGGHAFASISAGLSHTCGVGADGTAYCWGAGGSGQLGTGVTSPSTTPEKVVGGLGFQSISAGLSHTCGVTSAGDAYCWGANANGQLGIGSADTAAHPMPTHVTGGLTFSDVRAGASATCGLSSDAHVYCWGANSVCPASASGAAPACYAPVLVSPTITFTALDVATSTACALSASGTIYCWGGPLALSPTSLTGAPPMRTVSGMCGMGADGVAYCWGPDLVARRVPGQP